MFQFKQEFWSISYRNIESNVNYKIAVRKIKDTIRCTRMGDASGRYLGETYPVKECTVQMEDMNWKNKESQRYPCAKAGSRTKQLSRSQFTTTSTIETSFPETSVQKNRVNRQLHFEQCGYEASLNKMHELQCVLEITNEDAEPLGSTFNDQKPAPRYWKRRDGENNNPIEFCYQESLNQCAEKF